MESIGAAALIVGFVGSPLFSDTPPTISKVGTLITGTVQPSQAEQTLSVSPRASGDLLAVAVETKFPSTPSFTVTTITGGGAPKWNKVVSYLTVDRFHDQELWCGTVTTSGPSTITLTFTSGSTAGTKESSISVDVQEFRSSAGTSTVWSADEVGRVDTAVASPVAAYPALKPTTAGELYFGYLAVPGAARSGRTPGFVYDLDADGNQVAYDSSVSEAVTPTAPSVSQTFSSIGMLIAARPSNWWL